MTSATKQSQLEADVRARGLEYECPTCGMKAGKRCAMLRRDDGKRTAAYLPPDRSHPERAALAWRAMVAAGEVSAP